MAAVYPLIFAALLFCVGVYGVLSRRNAVLVLMSVEIMLASVTINLVTFGEIAKTQGDVLLTGQVFALFVLAVGAAEVGVGLALVLLLYRNRSSVNIDEADLMKY
ncbi:MAG: NADH-quinone oxidoreductase subunit NuoK [Actinomycetota bacterium]|jgi:NADH:ubiquinone oxidoreductase subunit K|nr:NADH-quinone oxidoreductase subunit NuoK [Actinomycetota bacterium]MDQ3530754.1 NADH-quinone oxidoreductase subunit NuoK [Actinomycetota bacterium]